MTTTAGAGTTGRVSFRQPVSILTGGQTDVLPISNSSFNSTLTVDLGNADGPEADLLMLHNGDFAGPSEFKSTGLENIHVQSSTGFTTRLRRDTAFALGAGSVFLGASLLTPEVIFDGRQTFKGKLSRITVKYLFCSTACRFIGPGKFRLEHADVYAVIGRWPE